MSRCRLAAVAPKNGTRCAGEGAAAARRVEARCAALFGLTPAALVPPSAPVGWHSTAGGNAAAYRHEHCPKPGRSAMQQVAAAADERPLAGLRQQHWDLPAAAQV